VSDAILAGGSELRTLTTALLGLAVLAAFGSKAQAATGELAGSAVIRCRVNNDGTLMDCQVLSQEPKDGPIGQNAIMTAKVIKLQPDAVAKAMRMGGFFTTRIVFKNSDQPNNEPPKVGAPEKAPQDEDWRLLARVPDRWVFIQGQRSRTKDLSRVVFVTTAYMTPRENLGHTIASSLDADLFDCGNRAVKLMSRVNFGENGQPVDAGNYGGVPEPTDEGTLGQLKIKIVCDGVEPSGPNAPSQGLAVGLVKGMTAQLPAEQLEKMVPTQNLIIFEPPPLKLVAPQSATTRPLPGQ
jgi:hypothetical protein